MGKKQSLWDKHPNKKYEKRNSKYLHFCYNDTENKKRVELIVLMLVTLYRRYHYETNIN